MGPVPDSSKSKRDIIDKIEKLYKQQQQLSKSIQRSNLSDIRNQEEYSIKLDKLFDIAHAHSNYLIQFEEDRQFLAQQRIYRSGSIGGIDSSLATLEGLSAERRARRELSQSSAPKSQFTSQEIDSEPDETTYEDTRMMGHSHTIRLQSRSSESSVRKLMQFLTEQTPVYARHQ